MAQINVPESINKEIKNIITEYLSKKDYLDKDSYILDGVEAFLSSLYDDSLSTKTEGEVTIHIIDKNISTFINQCFTSLWNDAEPIARNDSVHSFSERKALLL